MPRVRAPCTHAHNTTTRTVKPEEQAQHGALAAAGLAHKREFFSRWAVEGHVAQLVGAVYVRVCVCVYVCV